MSKTTRIRQQKTQQQLRDAERPAEINTPTHIGSSESKLTNLTKRSAGLSGGNVTTEFSLAQIDQPKLERLTWLLHNTDAQRKTFQQLYRWEIRSELELVRPASLIEFASCVGGLDIWGDLLAALTQNQSNPLTENNNALEHTDTDADWISRSYLALGAGYSMQRLAQHFIELNSREMIETTIAQAGQFQIPTLSDGVQIWVEQLLAVELPLCLATGCSDFLEPDDWIEPALGWMAAMIDDKVDSDGWPVAEILPYSGPLLASWLRSTELIGLTKNRLPKSITQLIQSSARQLLRLTRYNGTLMFSPLDSVPLSPACWKAFKRFSDDRIDRKLAKRILDFSENPLQQKADPGGSRQIKSKEKRSTKKVKSIKSSSRSLHKSNERRRYRKIDPSSVSEYGCSGIMSTDWQRGAPKVVFDYFQSRFKLEIGHQFPLVMGDCLPQIWLNEEACYPTDEFVMVCEHHDEDVDYVELQMPLTQQLTLVRQVLLIPQDDLLMIADCLTPLQTGKIQYECAWPLAGGISVLPESETREVYLQNNEIQSLVMPVSLPEWRIGPTSGRLEHVMSRQSGQTDAANAAATSQVDNNQNERCCLQLKESQTGTGLYVPLIFDLDPLRSRQKRTWRQLTLVESRQPVARDQAVAFRVQIGEQQWYFYRAIGSQGNRSFFGDNFNGEFLFGRFQQDGAKKELIRIE